MGVLSRLGVADATAAADTVTASLGERRPEDVVAAFVADGVRVRGFAVGAGRPFPYISNLSLSLIVRLRDPDSDHEAFARVKVPKEVLPRFVEISTDTFIPLEDIIAEHLGALFPGMEILGHDLFHSIVLATNRSSLATTYPSTGRHVPRSCQFEAHMMGRW